MNFMCSVESHPVSSIQWFKDGSLYNGTTNTVTTVSTDSKTVLQSSVMFPSGIKRSDFGMYSCNASNAVGNSAKSSQVTVWCKSEFFSLRV